MDGAEGQGLPPWAVSALKWAGALLALLLLFNYAVPKAWDQLQGAVSVDTGDDDEGDDLPAADAASTEPDALEEGEIIASTDIATRNGTIRGRTAEMITLGADEAEQLLLGFEPVPSDPACLTQVLLEVLLQESASDTALLVRPATLSNIAELEDGQALPPDAVIEGSTPARAQAAGGSAGWLRWDITGPYLLSHRTAPPEGPIVLSVSHPEDDDPERAVVLATTDGPEETHARLHWTAVEECSDLGEGGGVDEENPELREEAADVTGEEVTGEDAEEEPEG